MRFAYSKRVRNVSESLLTIRVRHMVMVKVRVRVRVMDRLRVRARVSSKVCKMFNDKS